MDSQHAGHISWEGDIDLSNVQIARTEIDEVTSKPGLQTLVIDLGDLRFVDSLGLGMLVYARERCLTREVRLQLRNTPQSTQHLLRVAGLDELFVLDS